MSVNRYKDHVYVIPEDDADRQIVNGFRNHDAIDPRAIDVRGPAGGWSKVRNAFLEEYVPLLGRSSHAHVVMVIDFDEKDDARRRLFDEAIPPGLRSRAFLIGSASNPERLRSDLGMTFETIGRRVADDCSRDEPRPLWLHDLLIHIRAEFERLKQAVRPFLFRGG
ncbi:hypothetical protein OJF2_42290 [Aquisphaera giovannonii]|uniref:Uncharacterized protein n=1 Tax=Aquisphaera giovannonii TaxID=406548 RepID=A0A5B9W626_9BACT|nr:hypothetical protein [Aquisphaera giovannonii]QEH35674.1 hypothetical protein OJF2_42290 [Aquisphaera giovannonii]